MVAYKGKDADNVIKYFDTVRGDGTLASPFGSVVVSSDLITPIKPVLAVDTANYLQNDLLTDKLVLTGAARANGLGGYIHNIILSTIDNPSNNWAFKVVLFHEDPTASTIAKNGALAVNVDDLDKISGTVSLSADQVGSSWVYQAQNLMIPYKCGPLSSAIYMAIVIINTTITQPSSATVGACFKLNVGVLQN